MSVPSECPVCGRRMCDHTPTQRGQSFAEMMGDVPVREARQPANAREDAPFELVDQAVSLLKKEGFAFAKRDGGTLQLHLLDGSLIVCKVVPPIAVPAKLDGELPYFGRQ